MITTGMPYIGREVRPKNFCDATSRSNPLCLLLDTRAPYRLRVGVTVYLIAAHRVPVERILDQNLYSLLSVTLRRGGWDARTRVVSKCRVSARAERFAQRYSQTRRFLAFDVEIVAVENVGTQPVCLQEHVPSLHVSILFVVC